ncbi:MAG: hypothetical protein A2297_03960 [Elusimicrobia bacterium RIFOXYB2_FULL_48_7]|nr:MAG: hypothetical protein A2297_03960 [Elusimicrobia bacterium RIFOXYB2_FULL_48_7]
MDESLLKDIIAKAKNYDLSALEVLCEHFYHRIYNYIFYKVSSQGDAEDLTSEVFIRMVKNIAGQSGSFKTWLYKIASNLVIDHYRQRSSVKKTMAQYEELLNINSQKQERDAMAAYGEFGRLLSELTPEQREVVTLRFIEGFSAAEIGKITQRSENAVKALQFRAMTTLREKTKGTQEKNVRLEILGNKGATNAG